MRIFPFFYCLTMRFQHGSYKGEEDESSLQTVSVAKSSWWQGEIHSSLCCSVFRDSNPKSWEFLLLCELEIAEQQQLKTWQLWSNSNPGGILEFTLRWDVPKWKVFFEDVCAQKLCLVLKCQIITGKSPNLVFSCCDATRSRNPWAGFVWGLEHQDRHSKVWGENGEEELERSLEFLAAPASPLGAWQGSKLG